MTTSAVPSREGAKQPVAETKQSLREAAAEHLYADAIATQLPPWFTAAPSLVRAALRQTLQDWHETQTQVEAIFERLVPVEKFAEPLIKTALAARGFSDIDPQAYGLKHVRLLSNAVIFAANQQLRLVDTLVRQLLPDILIPESLELNLVSSISRHNLLHAALQNFDIDEVEASGFDPGSIIFSYKNNTVVKHPTLTPQLFASVCRDLNLGEQYQWHLNHVFAPVEDAFASSDVRSNAYKNKASLIANVRHEFTAQLHMALMKRQVSNSTYGYLWRVLTTSATDWSRTPLRHSTFEVMGFEVPGFIVLWPDKRTPGDDTPCTVYMQHAPHQVFYEFERFFEFKVKLYQWLKQPGFANYMADCVPLRYRAEFIRRTGTKEVPWDSLLLRSPPIINEPAIFNASRHILQAGDPFAVAWSLQLSKIKDDARMLAVPTGDQDSKSRLARQVAYLNAGLSVLPLVLGFVPVVGEVMFAFGLMQLGADIYHGVSAWRRNDRVSALHYLFDVAQNIALIAAPAAVKAFKPSPAVDALIPVTLQSGQKRLWRPDLRPYQRNPKFLEGVEPDTQGIYTRYNTDFIKLDDVYAVSADRETGKGFIQHPTDPDAYTPTLRHNTRGRWTHELENPLQWTRSQLFTRLGPQAESLSPATAERIMQITGTNESVLRRVHMDNLAVPPLLADCIKRVRLCEKVQAFISEMSEGTYTNPDAAPLQLDVMTQLPGWPHDRILKVVDIEGMTVKEYGHDLDSSAPRLQIAQAQIDKGDVLKVTLDGLSQAQINDLLADEVVGEVAQLKALGHKIAEAAKMAEAQWVARLYNLAETVTPELASIKAQFPTLPVSVLEELVAHLTPPELLNMSQHKRLPLHILEEAREFTQALRVNRALEGLYYGPLSQADSNLLAWHTLPFMQGWPSEVPFVLRSRETDKVLSAMGPAHTGLITTFYQSGSQYEHRVLSTGQSLKSAQLSHLVFQALSTAELDAMNIAPIERYTSFKSEITRIAAQRRSASAELLGMHSIKPWFTSPRRLADGRLGYTLGGRAGRLLPPERAPLLNEMVSELYPLLTEDEMGQFLLRLRVGPVSATRALLQLKQELATLTATLDSWTDSQVWTQLSNGERVAVSKHIKRAMSQSLIRAWRRQTPRVTVEHHLGYELNLDRWPVDSLPPLTADFSHVIALHVSHLTGGGGKEFLGGFKNLRLLSLTNNHLTELPSVIGRMHELRELNVQGNQMLINDSAAATLSALTQLKSLNLTGNTISGTLSVHRMINLQHLMLRHTGIQTWPEGIQTLTRLHTLDLRNNAISHIPERVLTPAWTAINRVTSLHDNPLSADSLRRLERYRQEYGVSLGITSRRQHVVPARGIFQWAAHPNTQQASQWSALRDMSGSADFFRVIEDLTTSSQYAHTRADLTRRVWRLLSAAHDSERLRTRLFALAAHPRTCADGIAMIFADMELSVQVLQAETSINTEQKLLNLGRGLFRIEVLDAHVLGVIEQRIEALNNERMVYVRQLQELSDQQSPALATQALADMDPVAQQGIAYRLGTEEGYRLAAALSPVRLQEQIARLDPLEIQMYYHVKLAGALELPARPTSMRFANVANVTTAELSAAKQHVFDQEKTAALINSIEKQQFWGDFLQKKYPDAFSGEQQAHQERMDDIYTNREALSNEEYLLQSQAVADSRMHAMAQAISRLTQQELEQHPFSVLTELASTED